jgi:SAM-dependent methyltransferase
MKLDTIHERLGFLYKSIFRAQVHHFTNAIQSISIPENTHALSYSTGNGVYDYLAFTANPKITTILATDIIPCSVAPSDQMALQGLGDWRFQQVPKESPLPFADASFDLVYHMDVIEHTKKPALFLSEQHRVLKPGGWLVFGTPNLLRPANLLKLLLGRLRFPQRIGFDTSIGEYIHETEYTEFQLRLMLEEVGFSVHATDCAMFGISFLRLCFAYAPRGPLGRGLSHIIQFTARKAS